MLDTLSETSSFSTDLRTKCTDADNDLLVFTLLGGCPGNDTILNGIYKFTATPNVTGTHLVRIVATDPYNASDTNFIKSIVTSTSNDTLLPQITLVTPSNVSAITISPSYVIDVYCSDASGIASVVAEFNGNQFPGTPSNGHYTMMVNGLKQEVENSVVITVKDGSARHNETKKTITLSFANLRTIKITYDGNLPGRPLRTLDTIRTGQL